MKLYIVTVCRNALPQLAATIHSVNLFRSAEVQYVVVDGNSTDGTKAYLESVGVLVDKWVSEPDDGIYDAMNKAVSLLPSEDGHLLFLGAGDLLRALPEPQQRDTNAILYGDVNVGGNIFHSSVGWKLRAGNTLHHQGLFVPKRFLGKAPFDTRFRTFSDFDLNQRLLKSGHKFRSLGKIIAYAEPGGISWHASHSEMLRISSKNFGSAWGAAALLWLGYRMVFQGLRKHRW